MWEDGLVHTVNMDCMLGSVGVAWEYVGFMLVVDHRAWRLTGFGLLGWILVSVNRYLYMSNYSYE